MIKRKIPEIITARADSELGKNAVILMQGVFTQFIVGKDPAKVFVEAAAVVHVEYMGQLMNDNIVYLIKRQAYKLVAEDYIFF